MIGMPLIPVRDIDMTDNERYRINGSVKKERLEDALKILQISHKKSMIKRKDVDLNTLPRNATNSVKEVKGVNNNEIIWHIIAIIDEINGKIGVDIISLSKLRPNIFIVFDCKTLLWGDANTNIEKTKTTMWQRRLINKHIFNILNDFFKLLQIKICMHKIKIKIIPITEVQEIDEIINNNGITESNIKAKKKGFMWWLTVYLRLLAASSTLSEKCSSNVEILIPLE